MTIIDVIRTIGKNGRFALVVAALLAAPALAQNGQPIDGDLAKPATAIGSTAPAASVDVGTSAAAPTGNTATQSFPSTTAPATATPAATAPAAKTSAESAANSGRTYRKDDLIGAAEGIFGKGAAGLASVIEDLLRKQGEPNGYIVGREGGGAVVVGLRYGSGTLHHKIEGERAVYWTGPSVGFDLGANAASTFVLVYNLYDTEDLFHRFGAVEGQAYLVGGFHVSYLRRGDKVLIPVRSGAGLRLGANLGYMKLTRKANWLPF